jgi:hypothetical protein
MPATALAGPAAKAQPALPAPPAPPAKATQWATPAAAPVPMPTDAGGTGDGWRLSLPPAVAARLRSLLDRHDAGKPLTPAERAEAEGLLDLAEFLVVQRLRQRLAA